jgi:hypothetical protein
MNLRIFLLLKKFYILILLMPKYINLHLLDYTKDLADNEEFLFYNVLHIVHGNLWNDHSAP